MKKLVEYFLFALFITVFFNCQERVDLEPSTAFTEEFQGIKISLVSFEKLKQNEILKNKIEIISSCFDQDQHSITKNGITSNNNSFIILTDEIRSYNRFY